MYDENYQGLLCSFVLTLFNIWVLKFGQSNENDFFKV